MLNGVKKICAILLTTITLLSGTARLHAQEVEEATAHVAILNFINDTGSKNYDWLKTSIPDAVNESMLEVFEFKRTSKEWVQGIADEATSESGMLGMADIRFIAENTSSDIIIYGNYTFDKKSKKITINTKIFHLSRDAITGTIVTDTAIDNTLFQVVDKVAVDNVSHIEEIAIADEEAREKLALAKTGTKDKKEPVKKTEKKKKIVLKKASKPAPYVWDSWNIGLSLFVSDPNGIISDELDTGSGLELLIENSYRSFWHFGGTMSFALYENPEQLELAGELVEIIKFQTDARVGINYMLFNRIILQPYISAGLSIIEMKTVNDTGDKNVSNIYRNISISAGLRIPVRVWGIFITPGFSYTMIVDQHADINFVNLGLGVSF